MDNIIISLPRDAAFVLLDLIDRGYADWQYDNGNRDGRELLKAMHMYETALASAERTPAPLTLVEKAAGHRMHSATMSFSVDADRQPELYKCIAQSNLPAGMATRETVENLLIETALRMMYGLPEPGDPVTLEYGEVQKCAVTGTGVQVVCEVHCVPAQERDRWPLAEAFGDVGRLMDAALPDLHGTCHGVTLNLECDAQGPDELVFDERADSAVRGLLRQYLDTHFPMWPGRELLDLAMNTVEYANGNGVNAYCLVQLD